MLTRLETYIEELTTDPAAFLITMAYTWGVILLSLILHECAHGFAALRCGDPTAKMLGRLSLNPARHLDPIGTLCMFLIGFGWAKPVPVNPNNFRSYRRDNFLVSIAGIAVNLTIFLLCVLISCIVNRFLWSPEILEIMMDEFGEIDVLLNPMYGWVLTFNGIDMPLGASVIVDSGHAMIAPYGQFMQHSWLIYVQRLLLLLAQVNLSLALFNLLPVPPLDGSHILFDVILDGKVNMGSKIGRICSLGMVVLIMTGVLGKVLSYGVTFVYETVLHLGLLIISTGL